MMDQKDTLKVYSRLLLDIGKMLNFITGFITGIFVSWLFSLYYRTRNTVYIKAQGPRDVDLDKILEEELTGDETPRRPEVSVPTQSVGTEVKVVENIEQIYKDEFNEVQKPTIENIPIENVSRREDSKTKGSDNLPSSVLSQMNYGYRKSNFQSKVGLNKQEEREILADFSKCLNSSFDRVKEEAKEKGYTIWPIYQGLKKLSPCPNPTQKVIGVRINESGTMITELIDVGGVDASGYGEIKL